MVYEEKCLDKTRPYRGINDMLRTLKDNGVKVGVLSNKADNFAKRIVAELFDEKLIDAVYGQKDEYPRKPSPESLYAMLKELGAKKTECLYVGDSNVDVQTALNAGVDFCGAQWGFRGRKELEEAGAAFVAETADDITKAVL